MINLLYDATVLANGDNKNSCRSGIFWVSYNILKELNKNKQYKIYLYCSEGLYYKLYCTVLKNNNDFNNCTLLINFVILIKLFIFKK